MSPIPLTKLRRMRARLVAMAADLEAHYPGVLALEEFRSRSDSMSETMRNVATAAAEIEGWVAARSAGSRRDPWPDEPSPSNPPRPNTKGA